MKCIELRLEVAKCQTMKKQKFALGNAMQKVKVAIDHVCGLLESSQMVLEIKEELNNTDLVYVMVLTERFSGMKPEDLEEIDDMIESYITKKYGEEL